MNPYESFTRRQLLRRAAAGGAVLSLPALLAACGGGGGGIEGQQADTGAAATTVKQELADEITVSNWPYYIDQNDDATRFPTLEEFEGNGRQGQLPRGHQLERGVLRRDPGAARVGSRSTRTSSCPRPGSAARLLGLGYLQKLDKSAIPNMTNLEDTLRSPAWDPNRDYSLPWQSYITGIGYDPEKVGGDPASVSDLLDPALKGKITMLDSGGGHGRPLPPRDGRRPLRDDRAGRL